MQLLQQYLEPIPGSLLKWKWPISGSIGGSWPTNLGSMSESPNCNQYNLLLKKTMVLLKGQIVLQTWNIVPSLTLLPLPICCPWCMPETLPALFWCGPPGLHLHYLPLQHFCHMDYLALAGGQPFHYYSPAKLPHFNLKRFNKHNKIYRICMHQIFLRQLLKELNFYLANYISLCISPELFTQILNYNKDVQQQPWSPQIFYSHNDRSIPLVM